MKTIGLPRMLAPKGLARDFSPSFISRLSSLFNANILIEKNFGSDLGYKAKEYKKVSSSACFVSRQKTLTSSDLILSITSPSKSDIKLMREKLVLIAMLHYETHQERNLLLRQKKIRAISLDSIKDYEGKRIVQDYYHAAWNAATEGFIQLRKLWGNKYWFSRKRRNIRVYLLGFGQLGKEAADATLNMGSTGFQREIMDKGGNPLVEVTPVNHLHSDYKFHNQLFKTKNRLPDIVIDASRREDSSKHILTAEDICLLPEKCVIIDISADRYEKNGVVKGIQGIPTGDESKYVFMPKDPEWGDERLIPKKYQLATESQRVVVSHYAWPSYGTRENRIANMQKYEYQLYPIIKSLLNIDFDDLPEKSKSWSREGAIVKAML